MKKEYREFTKEDKVGMVMGALMMGVGYVVCVLLLA